MELVRMPFRIGTTITTYLGEKVGGMMQTLLFPSGGLRSSAALLRPRLGFQPAGAIHGKEITDIHLRCSPRSGEFRLSISSIRSEGNRSGHPRRNQSRDKTSKEAGKLKDQPAAGQDEISALFKRIRTSLSKDGPAASASRRINAKIRKDRDIVELIPEFPRQEQVTRALNSMDKGRRRNDDDDAILSERSELLVGETANHANSPNDAKAARPVSNFVKKSPISRPVPSKEENNKDAAEQQPEAVLTEKQLQPVTADRVLQNLDELKVPELKEIAKGKGVKGYSKMKKGELLQLLKGLSEST